MHPRAANLITSLQLAPHPEGGYFREIYRSTSRVQPHDGRAERSALTTIYFLLTEGSISRWHRVASDEAWHHYEGDSLELFSADPKFELTTCHQLGPLSSERHPAHVVAADSWQAARPMGPYSLVGCTVGPGFDFADFQLLRDHPSEADHLTQRHGELACFL